MPTQALGVVFRAPRGRIGLEMELEEATGYTLRSATWRKWICGVSSSGAFDTPLASSSEVTYQLRSAICHYGEVPEGGAYKAFALHCDDLRPENGQRPGPEGRPEGSWHVLDDAAVRCKRDIQETIDSEGHHACLLMFRRQDTKTVNLRPHAAWLDIAKLLALDCVLGCR